MRRRLRLYAGTAACSGLGRRGASLAGMPVRATQPMEKGDAMPYQIKLACNYYEETAKLVRGGRIDIDAFKYPSLGFQMKVFDDPTLETYERWVQETQKLRPVMLHGLGQRGNDIGAEDFREKFNPEAARRILGLAGVKGVSLHLCGGDTGLPVARRRQIILDNISFLKNILGELEFFSLENVDGNPYSDLFYQDVCIQPDFIREIVEEADVDFLLDISHAYGSAAQLGMDVREYMGMLPLNRLYEIHINGWIRTETGLMAHTKIHPEGYELLEEVVQRCWKGAGTGGCTGTRYITLEYGRGDDRLTAGIPLMREDQINERAMTEIEEQIRALQMMISTQGQCGR